MDPFWIFLGHETRRKQQRQKGCLDVHCCTKSVHAKSIHAFMSGPLLSWDRNLEELDLLCDFLGGSLISVGCTRVDSCRITRQDTKYEFGVDEKGVIHVIDEAGASPSVAVRGV